MEKRVDSLVFRRMTYADFFNINKVGGEEVGGGGQSYFDIPLNRVSIDNWNRFLGGSTGRAANGPFWIFDVNSLGINQTIPLKIYQRAATRCAVASQKLPENSRSGKRVPAWRPINGFPVNYNPDTENLVVYIIKTTDGEYWAGWFLQNQMPANWVGNAALSTMFTNDEAGYLKFRKKLFIDTTNRIWPFHFEAISVTNDIPIEEDIENELESEDTSPHLQELIEDESQPEFVERVMKIRQRNHKLVKNLKDLYRGKCQISGEQFTFQKRNGELYSEVHHLIPLGENGSDAYSNAIVVSPLIHRMLHYATVSNINLNNIVNRQLPITINGVEHIITWNPDHNSTVEHTLND